MPLYNASTGFLQIVGADKDTVIVSGTDTVCCTLPTGGGTFNISGCTFKMTATSAGPANAAKYCIWVNAGASSSISNCNFQYYENSDAVGVTAVFHVQGSLGVGSNCQLDLYGRSSNSTLRVWSLQGGMSTLSSDLTANGTFGLFVRAEGGTWYRSTALPVISGTGTGKRYEVRTFGVINTRGGGAAFLPGDVEGTILVNNQYS